MPIMRPFIVPSVLNRKLIIRPTKKTEATGIPNDRINTSMICCYKLNAMTNQSQAKANDYFKRLFLHGIDTCFFKETFWKLCKGKQ